MNDGIGSVRLLFLLLGAAAILPVHAASLNKCTGTDGAVFYTDRPCPGAGVDLRARPRSEAARPRNSVQPSSIASDDADAEVRQQLEQTQRRCASGDAGACRKIRTYRQILDRRTELKRRCEGGETLACDFYVCETTLHPDACARAQGRGVDSGFEVRRRQNLGPVVVLHSIQCLPSRIGRSVYEDRTSRRFEIRRNLKSPVVASFASLNEAANHACHRPAP